MAVSWGWAQTCTLDVGGGEVERLVNIFQLNGYQMGHLEEVRAQYGLDSRMIQDEIDRLFAEHPQDTREEMQALAEKYKVLQQRMQRMAVAADTEVLKTFNERQYQRYIELCQSVYRSPIHVVPTIYGPDGRPK
ncbi:MAG: hypothetical protein AB3N16_11925 [Flavobacteriaceae bacterium]